MLKKKCSKIFFYWTFFKPLQNALICCVCSLVPPQTNPAPGRILAMCWDVTGYHLLVRGNTWVSQYCKCGIFHWCHVTPKRLISRPNKELGKDNQVSSSNLELILDDKSWFLEFWWKKMGHWHPQVTVWWVNAYILFLQASSFKYLLFKFRQLWNKKKIALKIKLWK